MANTQMIISNNCGFKKPSLFIVGSKDSIKTPIVFNIKSIKNNIMKTEGETLYFKSSHREAQRTQSLFKKKEENGNYSKFEEFKSFSEFASNQGSEVFNPFSFLPILSLKEEKKENAQIRNLNEDVSSNCNLSCINYPKQIEISNTHQIAQQAKEAEKENIILTHGGNNFFFEIQKKPSKKRKRDIEDSNSTKSGTDSSDGSANEEKLKKIIVKKTKNGQRKNKTEKVLELLKDSSLQSTSAKEVLSKHISEENIKFSSYSNQKYEEDMSTIKLDQKHNFMMKHFPNMYTKENLFKNVKIPEDRRLNLKEKLYVNFVFSSTEHSETGKKTFSQNFDKSELELYVQRSKLFWPTNIHKYSEDLSLEFLHSLDYDYFKAIEGISLIGEEFLNFIETKNQNNLFYPESIEVRRSGHYALRKRFSAN
jgi:hypothetical protein